MNFKIHIDRELNPQGKFTYNAFLFEDDINLSSQSIANGSGESPSEALESMRSDVQDALTLCVCRLKTAPDIMLRSINPNDLRRMADFVEFIEGENARSEGS